MDVENFNIETLEGMLTADNETKAEFVRQCMPTCTSEDEFYTLLHAQIDALKGQEKET